MTPKAAAAMTEYYFVITLQASLPRGYANYYTDGTVHIGRGTTRREVFHDIYEAARLSMQPVPDEAIVLFFSLEPNELAVS